MFGCFFSKNYCKAKKHVSNNLLNNRKVRNTLRRNKLKINVGSLNLYTYSKPMLNHFQGLPRQGSTRHIIFEIYTAWSNKGFAETADDIHSLLMSN